MNQEKIGRFIAECRKKQKLTQMELAEKLYVTDRAVSKWENGRAMPDSSIMLNLCNILKITVTDLLSGEIVAMNNYNQEIESKLIEMVKEKQEADKRLLALEVFIGVIVTIIFLVCLMVASYLELETWLRILIIIAGVVPFIIGCTLALMIEQKAGYYECKKCGHKYVPTFKSVLAAMHLGRTRYLKCPKCHQRSWNKKVINND